MSFDSAFSGETYTTTVWSGRAPVSAPSRTSASIAARKAASVLPEPVGAAISACLPDWIAGHAATCAAVGAAKVSANQVATAGWKVRNASGNSTLAVPKGSCRVAVAPTRTRVGV